MKHPRDVHSAPFKRFVIMGESTVEGGPWLSASASEIPARREPRPTRAEKLVFLLLLAAPDDVARPAVDCSAVIGEIRANAVKEKTRT